MEHYDLAVVGAGAGLMVLEKALHAGLRCALVERGKLGGTCLTRGCIPTKMMVYPADLIREAERADKVNLKLGAAELDWKGLGERVWRKIGYHAKIEKDLGAIDRLTIFKGTGAFAGPHTMRVELSAGTAAEFEADKFVVAAGARTFVPPVPGLEQAGYITSETFFGGSFPEKPYKSLLILGGGAIGAEFAHIFASFGAKVTVAEMKPHLLATEEEEISVFVEKQFERDGIRALTGSRVISAGRAGDLKTAEIEIVSTGERYTVQAEEILVAAGVRSNADLLSIQAAGIETDGRNYITTNEYLETSQPHIWALGDINGKLQFRHKANYEADILSHNLFDAPEERKAADYSAVPWAVFTHPQVAHVGLTEQQARDAGKKVMVGRNRFSRIAGGGAMGYLRDDPDDGFCKLIVDGDSKIVGVHVAGPQAAILVQPFAYLMNAGTRCSFQSAGEQDSRYAEQFRDARPMCPGSGTYTPIASSMPIHPSLSELTAWALGKLRWSE